MQLTKLLIKNQLKKKCRCDEFESTTLKYFSTDEFHTHTHTPALVITYTYANICIVTSAMWKGRKIEVGNKSGGKKSYILIEEELNLIKLYKDSEDRCTSSVVT